MRIREAPTGVADDFPNVAVLAVTPEEGPKKDPDEWLMDMVYFLSHRIPPEKLSKAERKQLVVRSRAFSLINRCLHHKSADGIWRRVVRNDEQEDVLRECHCGVAGGHYAGEVTAQKVWQSGLWWPTMLKDAHQYAKECDVCQRTGCCINQSYHLSHSRNGVWISSACSNLRLPKQEIKIYSSPLTTTPNGSKQKL
jgi:hypothetical protein